MGSSALPPSGQPKPLQPGEFVPTPQSRAINFSLLNVQPPALVYIGLDDNLQVRFQNSVAGIVVTVRIRILRPDGVIVPMEDQFRPANTQAVVAGFISLTEGFLLSVSAFGEFPGTRRGQCFMQAVLTHAISGGGQAFELLLSDYISQSHAIGWPGGTLRESTEGPGVARSALIGAPAAGAEMLVTVPAGSRWRVISLRIVLGTSVAVAARQARFVIDDGVNIVYAAYASNTQAASLNTAYEFSAVNVPSAMIVVEQSVPMPAGNMLPPGFRIRTTTDNLQAADQWNAALLWIEEWMEL